MSKKHKHNSIWNIENLKEYMDVRFEGSREIADLKVTHLRELREADQRALDLVSKNNDAHFMLLNQNAERTKEERQHFVSREAFDPFKEAVDKEINHRQGKGSGLLQSWGILLGAIGGLGGIVAIAVTLFK